MSGQAERASSIATEIVNHRPYSTRVGNILFLLILLLGIVFVQMAYSDGANLAMSIAIGAYSICIYGSVLFVLEYISLFIFRSVAGDGVAAGELSDESAEEGT